MNESNEEAKVKVNDPVEVSEDENEDAELTENEDESKDDGNVVDDAAKDDTTIPQTYDITSFGADYDVEGLYRRLERKDVFIPDFQRDYVWKMTEASRFIESLLLGLPVPGVFLAKENETNKLLVIDGQQRLKTLQFFYNGYFNPKKDDKKQRVFALNKVQEKFEGLTYGTLDEKDRITLDNSIIHATIIKQESPSDDDTSIYHIFERLNNGGRKLTPQEIRAALYHGNFVDVIKTLNEYSTWREIFGKKNNRLKDQELILRFFALYFDYENYEKPMAEFLNKFVKKNKDASNVDAENPEILFQNTVDAIFKALGVSAFRPERGLNAAVFDSVMIGIAKRLKKGAVESKSIKNAYDELLKDESYITSVSAATSDERNVSARIEKAISAFDGI
jgi:hypothetical protein